MPSRDSKWARFLRLQPPQKRLRGTLSPRESETWARKGDMYPHPPHGGVSVHGLFIPRSAASPHQIQRMCSRDILRTGRPAAKPPIACKPIIRTAEKRIFASLLRHLPRLPAEPLQAARVEHLPQGVGYFHDDVDVVARPAVVAERVLEPKSAVLLSVEAVLDVPAAPTPRTAPSRPRPCAASHTCCPARPSRRAPADGPSATSPP